jgi:hypothetical protein
MKKIIVGVAAGIMATVCFLITLAWVIDTFDAIEVSFSAWPPRFVVAARRNLRLRSLYRKALTLEHP